MEIATQIKRHRETEGLSQEELAERLYVTRQTLSNWETGKTYPDLHSLLRLGDVFHVSLDELVKGDIQAMEEQLKAEDIKRFRRENRMLILMTCIAFLAGAAVGIWDSHIFRGIAAAAILAVIPYAYRVENFQRQHDILTFREVKTFLEGKRLDELEIAKVRERERRRVVLIVALVLLGVALAIFVLPLLLPGQ